MLTADLLRSFRKLAGWSQPQLAAELGVAIRTLRRWELEKNSDPSGMLALAIESLTHKVMSQRSQMSGVRERVRNLGFLREQVRCPNQACPRNEPGSRLYPGMPIIRTGWTEPHPLKGYPEYGKLIKFQCSGNEPHPHKRETAYWSLRLRRVVPILNPLLGNQKLEWWERQRGKRDACPTCRRVLRRAGLQKRGRLKGAIIKVCLGGKQCEGQKTFYFDAKTGRQLQASHGRPGHVPIPTEARRCQTCEGKLTINAKCHWHRDCVVLACHSPNHKGTRNQHWDLRNKRFVQHSKVQMRRLPPIARKVQLRNCPRCGKLMGWRMKQKQVEFRCWPCVGRYGNTHIICVAFDNREVSRRKQGKW